MASFHPFRPRASFSSFAFVSRASAITSLRARSRDSTDACAQTKRPPWHVTRAGDNAHSQSPQVVIAPSGSLAALAEHAKSKRGYYILTIRLYRRHRGMATLYSSIH